MEEEDCCFCCVYYLSQMGFNWVSGFYSFTSLLSFFFVHQFFALFFWSKVYTDWPTWLLNYTVSHFIHEFSTFLSLLTLLVSQIKSSKCEIFLHDVTRLLLPFLLKLACWASSYRCIIWSHLGGLKDRWEDNSCVQKWSHVQSCLNRKQRVFCCKREKEDINQSCTDHWNDLAKEN